MTSVAATLSQAFAMRRTPVGLLFLMARTVGGPIVKEVKPAALVGWVDTTFRAIKRRGKIAYQFESTQESLEDSLKLVKPESEFKKIDKLKPK